MKKALCIALICWLPLFMATAQAMSVQMELNQMSTQLPVDSGTAMMACHQVDGNTQSDPASHQCMLCGICMATSATASFSTVPLFALNHLPSIKPLSSDVVYASLGQTPSIKPPIFS